MTTRRSNQETNNQRLRRTLLLAAEDVKQLYLYTLERQEIEELEKKLRDNNLLPSKFAGMTERELTDHFHYECKDSLASMYLNSSIPV